MSQKRISVIMGIYNCADTLPDALDCLLKQSYTEWICIMCDDGSTDDTYNVASKYVIEYPDQFIILKNKTNLGLNKTLNKCIELVETEYIARMDGDDVCDSSRFEKEIAILDNSSEYILVSSWMDMFDNEGVFRTVRFAEYPQKRSFLKSSQFCHAGCMIKSDVVKALHGYTESDKYLRVEDYDLWVRLYAAGYKGYNIQESLYSMRDDRNAYQRRSINNRVNESRVILKARKSFGFPVIYNLFAIVPIIKYFLPNCIYTFFHKNK